jgi:hypothetical protein
MNKKLLKTVLTIWFGAILMMPLFLTFTNGNKNKEIDKYDSIQVNFDKKEAANFQKRRERERQEYADSLALDEVLKDALKIANQNIDKDKFITNYEVTPDSIPVSVEINIDYHFTAKNQHLIIRRIEPSVVYIDIYSKGDEQFEKVVSHEELTLAYVNDTIQDINGDGLKDFVENWYGQNGCCLKAFSNVFLLRQDQKAFSKNFEFINPTFSPKEKIIRGVCYGPPGETEMYKERWNGENVEVVEYVFYERNTKGKTGKVIVSTARLNEDNFKILKVLNSAPNEYKKIDGYNWFTGLLNE